MELEIEHIKLRDSLDKLMCGTYNSYFTEDQLEMAKKTSFILNYIEISTVDVTFEYGDKNLSISGYQMTHYLSDHIISVIRNQDIFKQAYSSFVRDWKINKIIN